MFDVVSWFESCGVSFGLRCQVLQKVAKLLKQHLHFWLLWKLNHWNSKRSCSYGCFGCKCLNIVLCGQGNLLEWSLVIKQWIKLFFLFLHWILLLQRLVRPCTTCKWSKIHWSRYGIESTFWKTWFHWISSKFEHFRGKLLQIVLKP